MAGKSTYTDEQKSAALSEVEKVGVRKAAETTGISLATLSRWVAKTREELGAEEVSAKVTRAKGKVEKAVSKAKDAAAAEEIEIKKGARKAGRKVKETAEVVDNAFKSAVQAVKNAGLEIIVQSPMGGNISTAEIAAKLPEGTETVFVRVDQNKLWWIKGEETGSVDIW